MSLASGVILAVLTLAAQRVTAQVSNPTILYLGDPEDCSAYYEYVPQKKYCPIGLLFSTERQTCDWATNVNRTCSETSQGCMMRDQGANNGRKKECKPMGEIENGLWDMPSCMDDNIAPGTVCGLQCDNGYEASVARKITCTEYGWDIEDNIDIACVGYEDRGDAFMYKLNYTLDTLDKVIFLMDTSAEVDQYEFVNAFLPFITTMEGTLAPLGDFTFSVVTFNDRADVVIPPGRYNRTTFDRLVRNIPYTAQGSSDVAAGLEAVYNLMAQRDRSSGTLVFILSASDSSETGMAQAQKIKNKGGLIFPVVVDSPDNDLVSIASVGSSGEVLYFEFTTWEIFIEITEYIFQNYGANDIVITCEALTNDDRSEWLDDSCLQPSQSLGTICTRGCYEGYELNGRPDVMCTERGWEAYAGATRLPTCLTIEETGESFSYGIDAAIENEKSNLLFVLDESGSVTQDNFDVERRFVKSIIEAFPLGSRRSAGVITFDNTADVDIPINEDDPCNFMRKMSNIDFRGGSTDISKALNLAHEEILRNGVHNRTLVFLVTDGASRTDPTAAADKIKAKGAILFMVGVAGYDENQLAPLASLKKNGEPYFLGINSFELFDSVATFLSKKSNPLNCES